jgi:hypothetical protein
MSSEIYIAHIGTGTLIHIDEAVLVNLEDEDGVEGDGTSIQRWEYTPDELRARVIAGTPLSTLVRKTYPGLEV